MRTTTTVHPTPTSAKSEQPTTNLSGRSAFVTLGLDMTWKLAIVVLAPIIGGVYLDNAADTGNLFLFMGLALAAVGSTVVMWSTMKKANSLPVPKLSAAEKREVQKRYEEDDKDA
jgi:hypothetical protein